MSWKPAVGFYQPLFLKTIALIYIPRRTIAAIEKTG
jgi:hypothetical protein